MRTTLERDARTLIRAARRRAIAAGAIASATLAPLVTSVVFLLAWEEHTEADGDSFLPLLAWGGIVGAVLGGTTVVKALPRDDAARARVVPRTIGLAALAGAAYFPVLAAGYCVRAMWTELVAGRADLPHFPDLLFAIGVLLAMSAVIGAPIGMAFGALFACSTAPVASELARPAHDLPQRASMWAAGMLALAVVATLLPASRLEATYCLTLFYTVLPLLEIVPPEGTDAAWTRYVVFAAVPLIAALGLALDALVRWCRTERWLRAIERGTHRQLRIDDASSCERALPLRHCDHGAEQWSAIVARQESAPYRSSATPLARIATPTGRRIAKTGSVPTGPAPSAENDSPVSAN